MRWRVCSGAVPIGDRLVGRSSGQVKGLGLDIRSILNARLWERRVGRGEVGI